MYEWVGARECGLRRAACSEPRHEQNVSRVRPNRASNTQLRKRVSSRVANEDMCALNSTSAWAVPGAEPLRVVVAQLGEDRLEKESSAAWRAAGVWLLREESLTTLYRLREVRCAEGGCKASGL